MDFSIPDATAEVCEDVRTFVREELFPLEQEANQKTFAELLPTLEQLRQSVKARGWWSPQVPSEQGGMGLGFLDFAILSEALGQSPFGHYVFNCQAPDAGNMEILIEYGTPEQKKRWLNPLLAGEIRSCFSMTEPDRAGSNPVLMDTIARRDGDEYVINGHKWFTTAADGADFAIVMAVTNPDAAPHARASQIIVPTDTPGFERVRNIPCMGHTGDGWASHSEIRYRECRVPVSHLLGEEGSGFSIAQARLGPGRIHHCMRWIGVAERCLDLLCERVIQRELAPDDQLASRQTIQNWIAESRVQIDAARLLTLQAGWKIDRVGSRAARGEISAIKFYVAEVLNQVIDHAIQAHGALGISDDTVLSMFFRNERAARIYDGPDEVHKGVVAREVLKKYGYSTRRSR